MSTQPQTQAEVMRATYKRVFEEMLNGRNLDMIPKLVTEDYVFHGPGGRTLTGVEQIREMVSGYLTAFPDLRMTIVQMLVEGDRCCTHWRASGTHNGPMGDIEPTGKKIQIDGIIIGRFEGTKIAEEWESFDELAMMKQIGAA